jgi:hypothetical protein
VIVGRGQVVFGWLAAAVTACALFLVPLPASLVEAGYSRYLFRWWQTLVTAFSNLAPFAWIDLFILGVAGLVIWRALGLIREARRSGVIPALWEGARRLIRAAAVLAILFLGMWGFNYRRVPIDATVAPVAPSVDDLRAAVVDAGIVGARVRPAQTAADASFEALTRELREPLDRALVSLGRPTLGTAGRPKYSIVLTPFFTWAGVDGMVDPFALETIVHPDLLPFERPFALAHEWAHLAGAADEAEASAVGWLACMNGPPDLVYSASVYLIVEGAAALPISVWREVAGQLDPGIRADLEAMSRRQSRQRPIVRRTAFRAYDQYLRANQVDDGVASYSRALSLILSPRLRDALSGYRAGRDQRP